MLLIKKFIKIIRYTPRWIKYIAAWSSLFIKKLVVNLCITKMSDMNDYFKNKQLFFILSIGRSGTEWLANLLNKHSNALIVHEPFIEAIPHQLAFKYNENLNYIQRFRKKEIYLRIKKNKDIKIYGEVNSYLRRYIISLKTVFPNAKLIHMVRDGRDVVRSMYSRETMLTCAYDTSMISPHKNDAYYIKWKMMSRFEKLCWYWMIENRCLRNNINNIVQFENLIISYEYFKTNILKPLNLDVTKSTWLEAINQPKNVTNKYFIPHWTKWNQKMRKIFEEICGEEMSACGYNLTWE